MDKYLESLVLKEQGEEVTEEPVKEEEVVQEIAEALEAPESEEVVEESEPEEVVEESEPEEVESPAEPEPIEPEDPEEEREVAVPEKKEPVKHPDIPVHPVIEPTYVVDIKIFNTPDPKGPFKIFTGNVIVKDKVGEMIELEYVKPGFGIVKGFTSDLK